MRSPNKIASSGARCPVSLGPGLASKPVMDK